MFEKLIAEPLLLVLEYGLLMARFLLSPLREVAEDIRCRLWRKRCLPLSFGGGSVVSISTCEGIMESMVSSGSKVSMVGGGCGKRLYKRQTLVLMIMEIYNAIVRQMVYLEVVAYPETQEKNV